MVVRAEDFDRKYIDNFNSAVEEINFDSNANRTYTGDKDEKLNRNIGMMCAANGAYIKHFHGIASLNGFANWTVWYYDGKTDGEKVTLKGRYGRFETTKQKLWDRLHIALEPFVRENQILIGLYNRGIDCWYDVDDDGNGIDITAEIDGVKVGIASWVITIDGVRRKIAKNQYHSNEYKKIPMIDAPVLLNGASTIKLKNGIVLYDDVYLDMLAAGIKSAARRLKNESCRCGN